MNGYKNINTGNLAYIVQRMYISGTDATGIHEYYLMSDGSRWEVSSFREHWEKIINYDDDDSPEGV